MLFLLAVLVVFAAAVSIAVLLKVSKKRRNLSTNYPEKLESPVYRSLFEADEAEIRAFERARLEAEKRENLKQIATEKEKKVNQFLAVWQNLPSRKNTIELLYLASQSECGEIYFRITSRILEFWRAKKINDLSADDLADVLESHFWLLPSEQRTWGVSFGLRQEIADLRRKSSNKK